MNIQKEMLQIQKAVTEMKNVFDDLIGKPEAHEERNFELEKILIEILKTKKGKKKIMTN